MNNFLLGGAVLACALIIGSSAADAAKARGGAQNLDGSTRALYARAWRECYGQFSGYRGPAGSNIALPAFEFLLQAKDRPLSVPIGKAMRLSLRGPNRAHARG